MILRKNVTCSTNYKFNLKKKSNFIKPVASQAAASSRRRVYLDTNDIICILSELCEEISSRGGNP